MVHPLSVLFINAARYGYVFGVDVVTVLNETDDLHRRARVAALEVYAADNAPPSK